MAAYPIWWDSTITLYNRYEDSVTGVITWHRTVLSNCFYKETGQKIKIGQVELESDNVTCRIPENNKFKQAYEWMKLPNDEMSSYFTLNTGDIVVKGEVDDEINDYLSGHRSSDFLNKYKYRGIFRIENVGINTGTGRGLPHYYISGV